MGTTRYKVIGQTGSVVLSDEEIHYKISRKRTARYRYCRCPHGYIAVIVGPFHSELYGTCSFGTKRTSAKEALSRRLVNEHGYIGRLMFSDVDEWDTVGLINPRLIADNAISGPISRGVLCGAAGQ